MIKVNVRQEDLEEFIDSLDKKLFRKSYKEKKKTFTNISFNDFKDLFCSSKICFSKDLKNEEIYKLLYKKISSDSNQFYSQIRNFIIKSFLKEVKFCPYCGKSPLICFDENNSKRRMFQFDHFFPKNIFHKGIINFYNLIPSCNACNHLKGEDNPLDVIKSKGVVYHPYFGNLYLDKSILKMDNGKNADIRLNYFSDNAKYFKLGQKYLNSQDSFNTFKFIQDKRTKMKAEQNNYIKNSSKSEDELKNYFFKNYSPESEDEILKYSNGKLKKDLIENLKI